MMKIEKLYKLEPGDYFLEIDETILPCGTRDKLEHIVDWLWGEKRIRVHTFYTINGKALNFKPVKEIRIEDDKDTTSQEEEKV